MEPQMFALGLLAVFNPKDGKGVNETIVAVIIVLGMFGLLFMDKRVPEWIIAIFSLVAGYFFSSHARENVYRRFRR